MKYKELVKQRDELRKLWEELEDPEDKKKVEAEGKEKTTLLSFSFGCYECDELLSREQMPNAFCSQQCHDTWAKKNYNVQKETRKLSIEEMQVALKQWGKAAPSDKEIEHQLAGIKKIY